MRTLAIALVLLSLAACQREERALRGDPMADESREKIALTSLSPGDSGPIEVRTGRGEEYTGNAYHQSEGKKLFKQMNCNGCHANGGGGMGVPLMDDTWIYGGRIENVVQTIREGRPNGMPSFRGKLPDEQIWQLAAYVLSMSRAVPQDVAPSRDDDMHPRPAESRQPAVTGVQGGTVPPSGEAPQ
ncbi:c-type cytochrome [Alsobacter sp. SYSU M60028]|uniref:C-type cytochrome n=1 Tax=Alsobacter ponti TaxID=2962936 RepID=A0ABT1LKV3_9HYPH|nr:c-type cytochrome [Alsobacter ponti]MCP8940878.1 c-type cytochrome [Alsobacter ponti]